MLAGYDSATYCLPPYWNANATTIPVYPGALGGYVGYEFDEINDPQPTLGVVNSAAAAFNWQETVRTSRRRLVLAHDDRPRQVLSQTSSPSGAEQSGRGHRCRRRDKGGRPPSSRLDQQYPHARTQRL